jgi:CRP/FNR family transcriptional regulator
MEDSHVCFIPREPFYEMVQNNAKLALKIAHLLADELKELEKKVTHSVQSKVRDRVAKGILTLIENYGFNADGQTINVQLKREDLANLAGTSRETATRYLYEFQEAGLLHLEGKRIQVLNHEAIHKMAHSKHI